MTETFEKLIEKYNGMLAEYSKSFHLLGYLKFLVLVALGICFFALRTSYPNVAAWVCLGLLALSVFLWVKHYRIHRQMDFCKGMTGLGEQYLRRISGEWTAFPDKGEEFADKNHPYGADLDIVGPKSLFQFLNSTNTWHGRQAFGDTLLRPAYTKEEIVRRQEAVMELSEDMEFSCRFQYQGAKTGADEKVIKLIEHLQDTSHQIHSGAVLLLLRLVPAAVALFGLAAVIFKLEQLYLPAVILLAAQGVFWVAGLPRLHGYLGAMAEMPHKLSHYAGLLAELENREYRSPRLREIQALLAGGEGSAAKAIKELDGVVDRINVRQNALLYFALNVLLLWDYQCVIALNTWKRKYAGACGGWFETLGEFESLLSLANLPVVCGGTSLPEITDKGQELRAKSLGHPLLPEHSRVCNDFSLRGRVHIISGSNMSGKTTFLRTVGINLVLARAGSPVCAAEMTCSLFSVRTSMRVADDLNAGVSTFYAELTRIKTILDQADRDPALFFFIDEIFRGTNSVDRLYGARGVLTALYDKGVVGMATTHDLELCALEKERPDIVNLSFAEGYRDKTLIFDYKLRQGPSRTTNAKYLMEMVGIL